MNSPLYPEIGFLRPTIWRLLKVARQEMDYTRRKNGTIIGGRKRGTVSTTVSTKGARSVAGRRISNRVVDSGKGKQGGEAQRARNETFLWPVARINSRLIVKLTAASSFTDYLLFTRFRVTCSLWPGHFDRDWVAQEQASMKLLVRNVNKGIIGANRNVPLAPASCHPIDLRKSCQCSKLLLLSVFVKFLSSVWKQF